MQIELYILLSGDRKPILLRIFTLILLIYDEPFQRYKKKHENWVTRNFNGRGLPQHDVVIKKYFEFFHCAQNPTISDPRHSRFRKW